jgi:hypothetical protein
MIILAARAMSVGLSFLSRETKCCLVLGSTFWEGRPQGHCLPTENPNVKEKRMSMTDETGCQLRETAKQI